MLRGLSGPKDGLIDFSLRMLALSWPKLVLRSHFQPNRLSLRRPTTVWKSSSSTTKRGEKPSGYTETMFCGELAVR